MAIYKDVEAINPIESIDEKWEGRTGKEVEDFISRRLKNPLGAVIDYAGETLSIRNPEGDIIASGKVTVVPPTYVTQVSFPQLIVNGSSYDNNVEINYTSSSTFVAGINIKNYYTSSGNDYDLPNKIKVVFYIEGTTDQLIVDGITPNKLSDDTLQLIDITPLFQKNLQGVKVKASVTTANASDEVAFAGIVTVHKIELSTSSTYVDNKTVVFNIEGLKTVGNMSLEYFDVPLGEDPSKASKQTAVLTGTSSTELVLDSTGAHQIVARISNPDSTFYSNWVQANIVSYDSNNPEAMMAIIGGIPTTINNCENANLYKIIYVPGLGGDMEIVSYLTDEPGNFENESNWNKYVFNQISISTTSNDKAATSDYYSYVELSSVGSAQKAIAFRLRIKNGNTYTEYPIHQLSVNNKGQLASRNYFIIDIKENPYNINNVFNYTEGARDNFSQITGQSTTLFTDVTEDIDSSDGWVVDENLIAYKISGQNKDLFNTSKDFSTLLNSGQGFSIEVMLKNYNINGDDPVMNIGNLLFGPGYTRVNSDDLSNEGIFVNSRADFEKDVITHLLFTYDPSYKPNTYTNIYDQVFNEDGITYSDITHTYPILKVYVNGCINREIQIAPELLKNEDGFKFQICPKSSDLNLYIFRTYTRALNYEEIKKNFISSRTTALEKKEIFDRNDIIGSDGRISFYKSMLNHNVIVFVLPVGEKPLFFGNRETAGDGKSNATILVRYKDEKYKASSGRFTGGKYKAQGSSAKKYMFHNTQYSKGMFLSEEQIATGITEGSNKYALPTDPEGIEAKKLVGKVNYASSMQSHKQGATKLYDRAYKEIFPEGTLYNGGKKACLEEAFMYFYYNVDDNSKLDTITIEDLYTTSTVNNIVVANDSNVKFLGFQTWGSAKADDPTYGYSDNTPEYVLFEGADNASPGANFKQPWAAFQTWDSTKTKKENQNTLGAIVQQPKSITETDYTTGLLIEGETIQFENDTDPLDVDYGVELLILDGQTEKDAENRDLWKFTDAVKNNSLPYFVKFYNNCYQYDFTNIIINQHDDKSKFDITNTYESTNKRIYMSVSTDLYEGEIKIGTASALDLFRWDAIKQRWVPAGLHYVGTNWETYNLKTVYESLKNDPLYEKYKNDVIIEDFEASVVASQYDVDQYIIPAFKDMFKVTIEEYCDKNDIAYHQAFIKLVSGTDNRAKNTYFQIIGKLYEGGVQTEIGDYKIRLMQDDLDTIFATDNNGQQVKPYYLLEPPFNTETEYMWGDDHSSFFYPFDVCYYELVNEYLGKIINHLFGSSTSIKATNSNLYDYFFSIQTQFPEIAYNHHAEIYYEMPQVIFYDGDVLKENGQYVFPNTLNEFRNNNVRNPLSLSHGRCLESEYQFMKDRLIMLGTSTTTASGLYTTNEISLSTEATGGSNKTTNFEAVATFTDYLYPVKSVKTSGSPEYTKIGNITDPEQTSIVYDNVFTKILPVPSIPTVISQLVTPEQDFTISCDIGTTMGAYLSAGDKYKSLLVNRGLDFTHTLLNLPNAKSLVIDGNVTQYSITESSIIVKNYLPVIENLVITNTEFTNSILDLRGCNRLESLNLSGCTGIIDIIFPENNRLTSVYLPNNLKKLTLGKNPNLSTFEFADNTFLTEVSLDCSELNSSFDYMDILMNRIDYVNLKQFILKNTPEGGLKITEALAMRLANIANNSEVVSLINGTYIITDRSERVNEYDVQYVWGDLTNISYNTKKYLVKAFGNIDNETNLVHFKYQSSILQRSSYKLSSQLSVDAPNGGVFKPFDGLYFTEGNSVGITSEGLLNITYSISGLPTGFSINNTTGELTITGNTNKSYAYSIVVTLTNGTKLEAITGNIYLGYIEPALGDFAYSDGSFSSIYDSDKTLVGLVFQKEVVTAGQTWKLGILSNKAITDYAGPDASYWNTNNQAFSDTTDGRKQNSIFEFMKNTSGLNISVSDPKDVELFAGISENDLIPATNLENSTINYNTYSEYPSVLVSTGLADTQSLAEVGLNRLYTISKKSTTLSNYLKSKGFLNDQNEFTGTWSSDDFESSENVSRITTIFNDAAAELGFNENVDYYQVIHPLAIRTLAFEPQNLSNTGLTYYKKGNWYIPSKDELQLLIWSRIRSAVSSTTSKSESYWNSSEYKGEGIFSDKNTYFEEFLNGTMLAAPLTVSGHNFIYGQHGDYNGGPYTIRYRWFTQYVPNDSWIQNNHPSCRRDMKYSIAPCCSITVNKN